MNILFLLFMSLYPGHWRNGTNSFCSCRLPIVLSISGNTSIQCTKSACFETRIWPCCHKFHQNAPEICKNSIKPFYSMPHLIKRNYAKNSIIKNCIEPLLSDRSPIVISMVSEIANISIIGYKCFLMPEKKYGTK